MAAPRVAEQRRCPPVRSSLRRCERALRGRRSFPPGRRRRHRLPVRRPNPPHGGVRPRSPPCLTFPDAAKGWFPNGWSVGHGGLRQGIRRETARNPERLVQVLLLVGVPLPLG